MDGVGIATVVAGRWVWMVWERGDGDLHTLLFVRVYAWMHSSRRSCMDVWIPMHTSGLVQAPVIAVPTSVGYGVGANGESASPPAI